MCCVNQCTVKETGRSDCLLTKNWTKSYSQIETHSLINNIAQSFVVVINFQHWSKATDCHVSWKSPFSGWYSVKTAVYELISLVHIHTKLEFFTCLVQGKVLSKQFCYLKNKYGKIKLIHEVHKYHNKDIHEYILWLEGDRSPPLGGLITKF